MTRTEKTPSAERFIKRKADIASMLTRLQKGIAEYGKGREDYFGKFDDLGYVKEMITRASDFLFQEGENAE
jgi:hypothetical protein